MSHSAKTPPSLNLMIGGQKNKFLSARVIFQHFREKSARVITFVKSKKKSKKIHRHDFMTGIDREKPQLYNGTTFKTIRDGPGTFFLKKLKNLGFSRF